MRFLLLLASGAATFALAAEAGPPPAPRPAEPGPDALAPFSAAIARAPAIAAALTRAAAAEQERRAAGVLPDPMIGGDLGRERPRMGQDMTMYGLMIEQALPRWGERDAQRRLAGARAVLAGAEAAATAGDLAAEVAAGLAELEAARDTLALAQAARGRADALGAAVRARLATGAAMLGERLAIDTRIQQIDLQCADLARRQADAEAMVRGLLGIPASAALPPFAAPDPGAIRTADVPMARSAAAMQLEAQAMEREAAARGNPETSIGLAWEREAAGTEEQSDSISLSLRVSLPMYRPAYRAAAEAARLRARAARHEAGAAGFMAQSRAGRAQRAVAQARQAERTAADIAARAQSEYDMAVVQAGSGGTTATAALALLDMITESGMAAIMARLDSRMALAELWRLSPPDLTAGTDP